MTRASKRDPLESTIEAALEPGELVEEWQVSSFVYDLNKVETAIEELVATDPARAAGLYEALIAGCCEKADEVHDEWEFAMFVGDLFRGWVRARQKAAAPPAETAARLLAWMDADTHGFCYQVEPDLAKAFDKAGLKALVALVRERFDLGVPPGRERSRGDDNYARRHWGATLRTLHSAQRDVAAYVSVAEATGLTPDDCHAVATMLASRRNPSDALVWIERGLELEVQSRRSSVSRHDLAEYRRQVLRKLGRETEALESAWADYCRHPSKYSYGDLMKFAARGDRKAWHDLAMAEVKTNDLYSTIELFIETKEVSLLAQLVYGSSDAKLEALSHFVLEPAARSLAKRHPDVAAKVWRANGNRIVKSGKSKYYAAAVSSFGEAKRCYERAGLEIEWQAVVAAVRAEHQRKYAFMPVFEEIVGDSKSKEEPGFLDRAKGRWLVEPPSKPTK